jgi:hypothetical protein
MWLEWRLICPLRLACSTWRHGSRVQCCVAHAEWCSIMHMTHTCLLTYLLMDTWAVSSLLASANEVAMTLDAWKLAQQPVFSLISHQMDGHILILFLNFLRNHDSDLYSISHSQQQCPKLQTSSSSSTLVTSPLPRLFFFIEWPCSRLWFLPHFEVWLLSPSLLVLLLWYTSWVSCVL